MKRRRMGHHEREAWIMAGLLTGIVVIGVVAGIVVQLFGHLPHH